MSENYLVWEELLSIWWPEVYSIVVEENRVCKRGGFLSQPDNVTHIFISEGFEPLVIISFSGQDCCVCPFTVTFRQGNTKRHLSVSPEFHTSSLLPHVGATLSHPTDQGQLPLVWCWLLSQHDRSEHKEHKVPGNSLRLIGSLLCPLKDKPHFRIKHLSMGNAEVEDREHNIHPEHRESW